MDNTQLPMAIILVDIKLLTMEDIKKKDMLLNNEIEVTPLKIIVLFQKARYEQDIPNLTRAEKLTVEETLVKCSHQVCFEYQL